MCRSEYGYPHGQARPIFRAFHVPYPALSAIQSPPAHPRPRGTVPQDVGEQGFQWGPSKRPARRPRPRSTATEKPPRFSLTPHRPATTDSCDGDRPYPPQYRPRRGFVRPWDHRARPLAPFDAIPLPLWSHAPWRGVVGRVQGLGSVGGRKIRHRLSVRVRGWWHSTRPRMRVHASGAQHRTNRANLRVVFAWDQSIRPDRITVSPQSVSPAP